ncbi:S24 family peptidase [Alcaligenes faecalis]|uniref:S24 family peptidase n=1 Tax=Alcaligenes faecalis TaxID=511 RepID=UPI001884F875|nr:S24 family peptidase [Alcaligenes faecalis]
MDSTVEIRRKNLAALAAEFGSSTVAARTKRSPTQISDMIAGRKSFGEKVARAMEKEWDETLDAGWLDIPLKDMPMARVSNAPSTNGDDAIFERLDIKAACGPGIRNEDVPDVLSTIAMPLGVAQRLLGTTNKNKSVKIIMATKDSMTPTILPDDLLFVDTSINEYTSEGIYLLVHDHDLVCKRLSRPGKEIIVTSDNDRYPPWVWSERPYETRIVGRVLRALPMQFKVFGEG